MLVPAEAGFASLKVIVLIILATIVIGAAVIITRSDTSHKLQSLSAQVDRLEQKAKSSFSVEDINTLDNLQKDIKNLEAKTTTLPSDTKAELQSLAQRINGLQVATGNTGPQGTIGRTGANGTDGAQGPQGPSGIATCPNGTCLSLQGTSPGVQETGNIYISGTAKAGSFSGSGSGLTNVDASYLSGFTVSYFTNAFSVSTGTLGDARLSSNVALLNGTGPQIFTGNNKFTGSGNGTTAYGTLFQNSANSATAFQIQNSAGTALLTADTTGMKITAPDIAVSGSITVGASGTPITQMRAYTPTLDPTSVATGTTAEQTFTVTGLTTSDTVYINKPSNTVNCGIVNVRVSAADTLAITFSNSNAVSACDPPSEVYRVVAIRS